MHVKRKQLIYSIVLVGFGISFGLMLYYGVKTFQVDEVSTAGQASYDVHIALIMEEEGNEYWHFIEQGAKQQARHYSLYLDDIGPKKSDPEEKLLMIDRMIRANVDGIITQGIQGSRFKELVSKAVENGVPIVTIDTDVPSSERASYVGTDNYQAGVLAGETLIADTTGKKFVGAVIGKFDALNQQERLQGFKDAIAEVERIELVEVVESNITEIGATQATYTLLKRNPKVNVLIGTSALDGIGIVQGIEEMNLRMGHYILAFDTLPRTLELIEQEKIDATIVQHPFEMGKLAVQQMMKLQNGEQVKTKEFTDTGVIRKQDVHQGQMTSTGDLP
ncbi:substrate-binding domain-containing protein [Aquibacillus sediminis]|uniref:substrate-binding domain-containing protein n=1 Tax=Aquibacillus sediminis TaxID=2574734 RepID=UPI001FEAE94C|nr:substrate-binding domain-containing protein [Aquibacillus sediminis]